jgi:predicted Zn-dependent peptidase
MEKIRTKPITDAEFSRAIVNFESRFVWGLESLLSRANRLQGYNHFLGTPDGITTDLDRYRKTTAAKVNATAAKYLTPKRRVEILTVPAAKKPLAAK